MLVVFVMLSVLFITGSSAGAFAQTNTTSSQSNTLGVSNSSSSPSTSGGSNNNPIAQSIDAGITAIKNGNNDEAKKQLYQAEMALEDKPNVANAEKHIEAALQALKDGDTSGAISHAEQAKGGLT